jgi:2-dehydropantoate 2-reductase
MAVDVMDGCQLELLWLEGRVYRLRCQFGVPSPLNFTINAALEPYAEGPPA